MADWSGGLGDLDLDAVTVSLPRERFIAGVDWSQTTDTVTLYLPLAPEVNARDMEVKFLAEKLRVALKRGPELLAGALGGRCDPDHADTAWEFDGHEVVITMRKEKQREWAAPLGRVDMSPAAAAAPPPPHLAPAVPGRGEPP